MRDSHANRIAKAYAKDEAAADKLVALGVPRGKIYRADKGETLNRVRMRKGEFLGVVGGLLGLVDGVSQKEIDTAIDHIHSKGATVLDVETGLDSRTHGVKMMRLAFAPKGPDPETARAMQVKSVEARRGKALSDADILKAEKIWDDPRYRTFKHALEAMGWRQSTAYHYFKKRFSRATRDRWWAKKS